MNALPVRRSRLRAVLIAAGTKLQLAQGVRMRAMCNFWFLQGSASDIGGVDRSRRLLSVRVSAILDAGRPMRRVVRWDRTETIRTPALLITSLNHESSETGVIGFSGCFLSRTCS